MITHAEQYLIRQISRKKIRSQERLFLVEGDKIVSELIRLIPGTPYKINMLAGLREWITLHEKSWSNIPERIEIISENELKRLSHLSTPNQVMALVALPEQTAWPAITEKDLILALDHVQDPGNTGTLIRLADWFGLNGVFGSAQTADFFSPKVVQASMGSIFRMNLLKGNIEEWIRNLPKEIPVTGTNLDGEDIYTADLPAGGVILMGNESRGLNPRLNPFIRQHVRIPSFNYGESSGESLNISLAAAIVCSEFRRRKTASAG